MARQFSTLPIFVYASIVKRKNRLLVTKVSAVFSITVEFAISIFSIIYIPVAFNTPLLATLDYEPNSGYSLIILTIGIIINSLIGYFNKTRKHFA